MPVCTRASGAGTWFGWSWEPSFTTRTSEVATASSLKPKTGEKDRQLFSSRTTKDTKSTKEQGEAAAGVLSSVDRLCFAWCPWCPWWFNLACSPARAALAWPAMSPSSDSHVSVVLQAAQAEDRQAAADLLPLVYAELHQLARARLARQAPGQTLTPTALVHEAYVRVAGDSAVSWEGRRHFF